MSSEMVSVKKQELEDLKKQVAENQAGMGSLLKALNSPNFGGRVRMDGQQRITGWMEDTHETVFVERRDGRGDRHHLAKSLHSSVEELYRSGYERGLFKSFGEYLHLGLNNREEFARRLNEGVKRLKAIQGLSEVSASDGGALILPEYSTNIFDRVYTNDLLSRCDQYTVAGNNMTFPKNAEVSRANGSRHGGLRGYWVGEGGTLTKSKPTLDMISLRLKKVCVLVYLTQELMEDAGPAIEAYVNRKASEEFNFLIGDALLNGSGANMPLGILNSPALLAIAKEDGQLADTIIAENIDNMWARRLADSENYVYLKNQDTGPQLNQLSQALGTGGQLLYRPPGGLSEAPYATLNGKPVIDTEFNPTVGDQGDILQADMSKVVVITKGGVQQSVSSHVEFLTDQHCLKFTHRIDAAPWEDSPITPYKGSNTQSSFVVIEAR